MKKWIAFAACAATLLALTGCISRKVEDQSPVGGTQIANPWVDCDKLAVIDEGGFATIAPDAIDGYDAPIYRVLPGKMVEIIYYKGNDEIRVRKALGDFDCSGDYNTYAAVEYANTGQGTVTLKGREGGLASLALWQTLDKAYSFSVSVSQPMSYEDLLALVSSVS